MYKLSTLNAMKELISRQYKYVESELSLASKTVKRRPKSAAEIEQGLPLKAAKGHFC